MIDEVDVREGVGANPIRAVSSKDVGTANETWNLLCHGLILKLQALAILGGEESVPAWALDRVIGDSSRDCLR